MNDANVELQMRVDAAENDVQVIYPQVETWLERARQSKDIIMGIENEIPVVQKRLLNLISRYSLSRKAKKIAEDLRELHNTCKFGQISQDAPPAAMGSLPLRPKEEFETRKNIEKDVMKALRDRNVNKIGLCGMGGIGKTTMAERIMDRVKEEKLFDGALKVVVSQQVEMLKIQQDIAEQLRLTLEGNNLSARAHKIRTRLTDTKSTLVVLDDVWERLELEDLGIPCKNTFERCKVLFTSRNRSVLDEMETEKIFGIQVLSDKEAWSLFKEKTDNYADGEDLLSIAENVAKECKGLPVALVTVGRALRHKPDQKLWEDAFSQLRSSNPTDLPRVLADVYKPLKLSYDYLGNQRARSLFLLCSMFEEDCNIDLELLTWYGMGLGMFEEFQNLNEVRNRIIRLVDMLKDGFLLLDGSFKNCVKMHDVVRDMAIYVASEEQRCGFVINLEDASVDWAKREDLYKDCSWISISNSRKMFPVKLKFPSLRLLSLKGGEELSDGFFDEIREISVLSMTNIQIKSLPPTTQLLKNLKTLLLFSCKIESISIVGELSKLEVLCCHYCDNITALPTEIGRLNRLRLLEIIGCRGLKRIASGIISKLINLEELRITFLSFCGWEAKESNAKENAALVELESLTKLTRLEIEIDDLSLLAEEICLPSKIAKYDIRIMKRYVGLGHDFSKGMSLEILGQINVGNWIKTLIRSTEFLHLKGDGADQVNLVEVEKLKRLYFKSCSSVKKLINTTKTSLFPFLESLELKFLDNLEEIIAVGYNYGDHYSCFGNLKRINIWKCPRLRCLFPMSVAIRSFPQLEELTVEHCKAVEDIVYDDDKMEKDGKIISHYSCFGNLKRIDIRKCPRLRCLFPVSVAIRSFPQLQSLIVEDCKAMEDIFYDNDKMEKDGNIISHNLHMAFPKLNTLRLWKLPRLKAPETLDKIVAPGLERLALSGFKDNISSAGCWFKCFNNLVNVDITHFNDIRSLMSSSVAGNLLCMREMRLDSCTMMLEVVAYDEEQQMDKITWFPALSNLDLVNLKELRSFCQWKHDYALEMPSLKNVYISKCPRMETFTLGSFHAPKLQYIYIDQTKPEMEDLNKAVQQHFKLKGEAVGT